MTKPRGASVLQRPLKSTGESSRRERLSKLTFERFSIHFSCRKWHPPGNFARVDGQLNIAGGMLFLNQIYPFALALLCQFANFVRLANVKFLLEHFYDGKIAASEVAQLEGRAQIGNFLLFEGRIFFQRS